MVLAETERECASVLAKKLSGICERSGRVRRNCKRLSLSLFTLVFIYLFYICFAIKTDYCKFEITLRDSDASVA